MEIEATQCMWYACPKCKHGNTVSLFNSFSDEKEFECNQCRTIHTFNGLLKSFYSTHNCDFLDPIPDKKTIDLFCSEFKCKCGCVNHVFGQVTKIKQNDSSYSESATIPQFGLCEQCFNGYDLVYPEMINPQTDENFMDFDE